MTNTYIIVGSANDPWMAQEIQFVDSLGSIPTSSYRYQDTCTRPGPWIPYGFMVWTSWHAWWQFPIPREHWMCEKGEPDSRHILGSLWMLISLSVLKLLKLLVCYVKFLCPRYIARLFSTYYHYLCCGYVQLRKTIWKDSLQWGNYF